MSKTHITKPWVITTFVGVLLIILIITWILVGEFNILHLQWLIAKNGLLWKGKVNERNLQWLQNTFGKYINDPSDLSNHVGNHIEIHSNQLIFNPLILIILLPCLVLSICVPLFFKLFHIMNIDVLPYSVGTTLSMLVLIFSGLIPHQLNSKGNDTSWWWLWIVRVIILLITIFVSFITINKLTNKFLSNTNYANAINNEFNRIEYEKKPYRDSLKNLANEVNNKDKMEYVEEDK